MMLEMYEAYGYFKETQYTITLKGIDGSKQIAEIMDKLQAIDEAKAKIDEYNQEISRVKMN